MEIKKWTAAFVFGSLLYLGAQLIAGSPGAVASSPSPSPTPHKIYAPLF